MKPTFMIAKNVDHNSPQEIKFLDMLGSCLTLIRYIRGHAHKKLEKGEAGWAVSV